MNTFNVTPPYGFSDEIQFEETFRSPMHQVCEADARVVLANIREAHPTSSGWVEISSKIVNDGKKWGAVRHHVQFRRKADTE